MYAKITTKKGSYEGETLSDFMEQVETHSDTIESLLDAEIITFDYKGNAEVHWNKETLHNFGINTVYDLYFWLCSDSCDWFS